MRLGIKRSARSILYRTNQSKIPSQYLPSLAEAFPGLSPLDTTRSRKLDAIVTSPIIEGSVVLLCQKTPAIGRCFEEISIPTIIDGD